MKKTASFRRKRPFVLPPLIDLQPSALRPMDPLQPSDLLFAECRLGSPAPRRNVPVKPNDIDIGNGKPVIKIFESPSEETETTNLNCDTTGSGSLLLIKKRNSLNASELESKKYYVENTYEKNHSRKHFEYLREDLNKKVKEFRRILPLEEPENLNNVQCKNMRIPNRYKPLKPIGQDKF